MTRTGMEVLRTLTVKVLENTRSCTHARWLLGPVSWVRAADADARGAVGQVVLQQNERRLAVPSRKTLRRFDGVSISVRHLAPVPLNLRHRAEKRAAHVSLPLLFFMQRCHVQTSLSCTAVLEMLVPLALEHTHVRNQLRKTILNGALQTPKQCECLSSVCLVPLITKGQA